ncbi:hypothetical protein D3C85_1718510 [compost metagenome]
MHAYDFPDQYNRRVQNLMFSDEFRYILKCSYKSTLICCGSPGDNSRRSVRISAMLDKSFTNISDITDTHIEG